MRASVSETRYYTAEVWGAHATPLFVCAHRHQNRKEAAMCARRAETRLERRRVQGGERP